MNRTDDRILVYKNTGIEFLDDFYSGDDAKLEAAFRDALAALQGDDDSLVALVEGFTKEGRLKEETPDHLANRWLPGDRAAGPEFARVLRRGYEEAIDLANRSWVDDLGNQRERMPIETFFVAGALDRFEIHVCEGKRQISVFMFLPPVPRDKQPNDRGSDRAASRSFVIRADDADEGLGETSVVKISTSGPR